jgi:osmotically inducible protein OsmC
MSETLYSATSTAWGGREGRAASDDGRIDVSLSMPSGLGGDDGPGASPEQLFATAYAAGFHSALKAAARQEQTDLSDSSVSVTISLLSDPANPEDGWNLAARIEAQVGGVDAQTAQRLIEMAHQRCPYSRATRGNISQEVLLVSGAL